MAIPVATGIQVVMMALKEIMEAIGKGQSDYNSRIIGDSTLATLKMRADLNQQEDVKVGGTD